MRIIEEPEYAGIFYKDHEKERIMRDPELREAYECGRKEAYKEIMEEKYGERRGYGSRGGSYGQRGGMNYRDEEDWDEYEERRRRDSRGRYM